MRAAPLFGRPQIMDGSWVIRQAVGSTPFIIGKKLATSYFRTAKYLEITVDIQSNATAASITGYVAGALKSLSISLGFVLEGNIQEHLPEQLLGARHSPAVAACNDAATASHALGGLYSSPISASFTAALS